MEFISQFFGSVFAVIPTWAWIAAIVTGSILGSFTAFERADG